MNLKKYVAKVLKSQNVLKKKLEKLEKSLRLPYFCTFIIIRYKEKQNKLWH